MSFFVAATSTSRVDKDGLVLLLKKTMGQSLSPEANKFSASQEILRILWNPIFQYRIHKSPPSVPILIQIYLVHTSNRFKVYFNSIINIIYV
jgi:hypothetical protein